MTRAIPWEKQIGGTNMKKYIYKITNKINGKSYIGQTKYLEKRWRQHITVNAYAIGKALRKYGVENFDFDVLDYTSDFDAREIYYIELYQTYYYGYNLTKGGESFQREDYTLEEIAPVIEELKNGELMDTLQQKYGHSVGFLVNLNYGRIYRQESLKYPLSPNSNPVLGEKEVHFIEDLLTDNQKMTLKEIAVQVGRGKTTIEAVNHGRHKHSRQLDFPLKKIGSQVTETELRRVIDFLSNTNYTYEEIALFVDREREVIGKINCGSHRLSPQSKTYPIR